MASFEESIKSFFSSVTTSKGHVLGVDIGSSLIKVIEVERVNERAVLRNYGETALGPRAGLAAGQATNLPPEKIAEALRELLQEMGAVGHDTIFAIPFNASLLSLVELPDIEQKQLESMIPLEARRYIPVPISEVTLDWWVLPKRKIEVVQKTDEPAKPKTVEVIIAAIHNEVIKKYNIIKEDSRAPGGEPIFEIEIFSTLRSVIGRDLSTIMVVDIGAGSTKLVLVDEGVVRGSHIINIGGQDVTMALSKSRGISFAEAEEIKCKMGISKEDEERDIAAAGALIFSNMLNEAARFAENYERKHDVAIKKVILVGGGARLKGIENVVKTNFPNMAVSVGDPFLRIETPAFLDNTIREISPDFAVAIGAALKGLEE